MRDMGAQQGHSMGRGLKNDGSRQPDAAAGPRPPSRRLVLAVCGFLLVAVAAVFGQTLRYGFVNYDDDEYVYDNRAYLFRPHGQGGRLGIHARAQWRTGTR